MTSDAVKNIFSFLVFTTLLIHVLSVQAQDYKLSRSGFPGPAITQQPQRPLPCTTSDVIYDEFFFGTDIPANWTAFSLDTASLHPAIDTIYQDGWQSIVDFRDNTNRVLASPSWHAIGDKAVPVDNWLVSPEVTLGSNTCFSWLAYSQDRFYAEKYEVLISPTGSSAIADFTDTLEAVSEEAFFLRYRDVNLAAYAGQTVRVAFRHTSVQQFILALDNIRFANVNTNDAGVVAVTNIGTLNTFDSTRISVTIQNFGSDSLDLADLRLAYRVNQGPIISDTLRLMASSKTRLSPNDTTNVSHPIFWNPSADTASYDLDVWTVWDADLANENDTFYVRAGLFQDVTSVSPIDETTTMWAYPNPTQDRLFLGGVFPATYTASLYDATGRLCWQEKRNGNDMSAFSLAHQQAGIYLLQIQDPQSGRSQTLRVIKQ